MAPKKGFPEKERERERVRDEEKRERKLFGPTTFWEGRKKQKKTPDKIWRSRAFHLRVFPQSRLGTGRQHVGILLPRFGETSSTATWSLLLTP